MCFNLQNGILNIRGIIIWLRLTETLSTVRKTVPHSCNKNEYTFKYFSLLLFQILPGAHVGENKMAYLLRFWPCFLFIES